MRETHACQQKTNQAYAFSCSSCAAALFRNSTDRRSLLSRIQLRERYRKYAGTTNSIHPEIFNIGAILDGVAGLIGAAGLFLGLSGGNRWLRALIAIGVFCNGVLSFKAGLFPMPDPRHASWQFLLFPILVTPLLMLLATWRVSLWLRIYLIVDIACLLLTIPMLTHRMAPIWPEGTMQRVFASVVMVPIGVVALSLIQNRQSSAQRLIHTRMNA
jgi:hypothetical protein